MSRPGILVVIAGALLATACASGSGVESGSASGPSTTVGPATSVGTSSTSSPTTTSRSDTTGSTSTDGSPGTTTTSSTSAPTTAPAPTTTTPGTTTGPPTPGDGLGDQPFPDLGNPGVDVTHYDLTLDWTQADRHLQGRVVVSITPTETRPDFTLDAAETLSITAVELAGAGVPFEHDQRELRITPPGGLVAGQAIDVTIAWDTTPPLDTEATGLVSGGWYVNDTGSFVINEPDLARYWMPCDDHPSDKATWDFTITVPDGMNAVANGTMTSAAGAQPFQWTMDAPMATYLVQVLIGPYQLVDGTGPNGLALVSAVLPQDLDAMRPALDLIGPMIDYFDDFFGPYPFASYGIAFADSFPGLAMEEQSRSLIPREVFLSESPAEQQYFASHELTHQWFGDAVTPASWQDIWLNEGFATYGQWMWAEHAGFQSVDDAAAAALHERRDVPVDQPGRQLFGNEVYDGGAVVLHALRRTVGDAAFFEILQTWVHDNAGTSRTTDDFFALASKLSGVDLTDFRATWVDTTKPPKQFP